MNEILEEITPLKSTLSIDLSGSENINEQEWDDVQKILIDTETFEEIKVEKTIENEKDGCTVQIMSASVSDVVSVIELGVKVVELVDRWSKITAEPAVTSALPSEDMTRFTTKENSLDLQLQACIKNFFGRTLYTHAVTSLSILTLHQWLVRLVLVRLLMAITSLISRSFLLMLTHTLYVRSRRKCIAQTQA